MCLVLFISSFCHTHTHTEFRHLVDSTQDGVGVSDRDYVCAFQNILSTVEKEVCVSARTHTRPHHYHQPTQEGVSGPPKDVDHVIVSRNRDSTPKFWDESDLLPLCLPPETESVLDFILKWSRLSFFP